MYRLLLLALAFLLSPPVRAAADIFQSYVVIDLGQGPPFMTRTFGPFNSTSTFLLKGGEIKTFAEGGSDIYQASMYYRFYDVSGPVPATYTAIPLNGVSIGGNDEKWDNIGNSINLLRGGTCGSASTCRLDVYFEATESFGGSGAFPKNDGTASSPLTNTYVVNPGQFVFNGAGYRLLSWPETDMTVDGLADINLVQGVDGADGTGPFEEQYPDATPNIYTAYGTTGYVQPVSTSEPLVPGFGFFWQFYDQVFPSLPSQTTAGGGTSFSRELTGFVLTANGPFLTVDTQRTFNARNTANGFYMIGNPFGRPLRADGVSAGTETIQGDLLQAYDPDGRTYRALDRGVVNQIPAANRPYAAVFQGFFAEVAGHTGSPGAGPTFTYDYDLTDAVQTPDPAYRSVSFSTPYVQLVLAGTTSAGVPVADEAAYVRVVPAALVGWDPLDASKLLPPVGPYALVAPVGERDGAFYRMAVNSLPADGQARTVPVAFTATDAGTFTLTGDATTTATLRDLVTGVVIDLATAESYTFTSAATDWTNRFELVLGARGATATDGNAPADAFRLAAARPNPVRGAATVTVELGAPQHVRAVLTDALGRRVLDVFDAAAPAGALDLRLDAAGLAPGVYVLRVTGASATATQTVTVVR
jgi:hypothetical protein